MLSFLFLFPLPLFGTILKQKNKNNKAFPNQIWAVTSGKEKHEVMSPSNAKIAWVSWLDHKIWYSQQKLEFINDILNRINKKEYIAEAEY